MRFYMIDPIFEFVYVISLHGITLFRISICVYLILYHQHALGELCNVYQKQFGYRNKNFQCIFVHFINLKDNGKLYLVYDIFPTKNNFIRLDNNTFPRLFMKI